MTLELDELSTGLVRRAAGGELPFLEVKSWRLVRGRDPNSWVTDKTWWGVGDILWDFRWVFSLFQLVLLGGVFIPRWLLMETSCSEATFDSFINHIDIPVEMASEDLLVTWWQCVPEYGRWFRNPTFTCRAYIKYPSFHGIFRQISHHEQYQVVSDHSKTQRITGKETSGNALCQTWKPPKMKSDVFLLTKIALGWCCST